MFIMVVYDIAQPKRLRKIAKVMEEFGTRVQRSVFECRLEPHELARLLARVKLIMKKSEDKVQIYPLCKTCQAGYDRYADGGLTPIVDVVIC